MRNMLVNTFRSNVAKQLGRLCCPFYSSFICYYFSHFYNFLKKISLKIPVKFNIFSVYTQYP